MAAPTRRSSHSSQSELRIPRARVTLLTGAASRTKSLRIAGFTAAQLRATLSDTLAPPATQ